MNIINHYREVALTTYNKAMNAAEQVIRNTYSSKDCHDRAMMLLVLAEFHILANKTWEAEHELREALDCFQSSDDSSSVECQIHIFKALSGIHACMGCAKESKREQRNAEKLEEKLLKLSSSVALEKNQ